MKANGTPSVFSVLSVSFPGICMEEGNNKNQLKIINQAKYRALKILTLRDNTHIQKEHKQILWVYQANCQKAMLKFIVRLPHARTRESKTNL